MITRSLEKARAAFKKKDIKATIAAHAGNASHSNLMRNPEMHQKEQGKYIKSVVYGGLDGTITTFAVVAGVAGASLSSSVVLILGFANLLADGVSMAFGDYLSTKAEREYYDAERKREEWEVDHYPAGEKKEMIELYQDRGISKKDAATMANILAKNKKFWVDTMMVEELGLHKSEEDPTKNAIATFLSFAMFGAIPLVTYILARFLPGIGTKTFMTASILTGMTLFLLGAVKVKITGKNWIKSGMEMFIVGGVAAVIAYLVGAGLALIV